MSETLLPPEPTEADARAGTIVVIDPSGSQRTLIVPLGQRVLVGGDPAATIVVTHPRVVAQHASIAREGPGWLVTSLDPANPIWMLDESGRAIPVMEEIGFRSATLLAGTTQLLLHPPVV